MASDLDADALAIASREIGMPAAAIARAVEAYRATLDSLTVEPDWRAETHMHGAGFSASTYRAEGCPVMLSVWSYTGGDGERCYSLPPRQKTYRTFREALAAHAGRTFRSGPRSPARETAGEPRDG